MKLPERDHRRHGLFHSNPTPRETLLLNLEIPTEFDGSLFFLQNQRRSRLPSVGCRFEPGGQKIFEPRSIVTHRITQHELDGGVFHPLIP